MLQSVKMDSSTYQDLLLYFLVLSNSSKGSRADSFLNSLNHLMMPTQRLDTYKEL